RTLQEPANHAPETKLFYRGDYRQPKQTVAPAALTVLSSNDSPHAFPPKTEGLPTTGRRLAFARWLTSRENPLTARAIVNRVWLHHFGRGLVDTPSDFGRLGTKPTHPELLDWLADEFMTNGWSLKHLHRVILLSTAYRQSSLRDPAKSALDADGRWYSRRPILRLDAEILRDRVLATSGDLDLAQFGPAVAVREDETGQVIVDVANRRRSVYIQQRRSQPVAMLQAFDEPVMETNCERRPSSTVATQSLMLMNGDLLLAQAGRLSEKIVREPAPALNPALAANQSALAPPRPPVWQFGYGRYDESTHRTSAFTPLPHWTGSQWQGSATLPDPQIGWVLLNAQGGHTGNNPDFAPIRRWTAPANGVLRIAGNLHHPSENGDGVRARITSSRTGQAGEWTAQHSQTETPAGELAVEAGDAIDFVVDCRQDVNSDSFVWTVDLKLERPGQTAMTWKSAEGFHGPVGQSAALQPGQLARAWEMILCRPPTHDELHLSIGFINRQLETLSADPRALPNNISPEQQALTNLCQTLLSTNEFLYVE
ncbi:MAG TPA: DUF1553 domain-containing protein, partial [Planctomycetaceae bacterium]|nr:DUF1553 domain-containing protein [Planctomycetaceae bacterium]